MTTIAIALLVAVVALAALIILQADRYHATTRQLLSGWELERAELLQRITHPDLIPVRTPPARQMPQPKDAANLAKIGMIAHNTDTDNDG